MHVPQVARPHEIDPAFVGDEQLGGEYCGHEYGLGREDGLETVAERGSHVRGLYRGP